ncbi:MAG: DegV family protein [Candidatus Paceibacterota bacterium]|jgi:DegV family protein with EDD domain|nr:DegV family protein [bacterium]
MKPLNIIIGTSASITKDIIEKYGFIVVDFKLIWEGEENIIGDNIFDKMREVAKTKITGGPKTSQPSIGVYKNSFEEGLRSAEEVICITISSKLSGAYNSAFQAIKMLTPEDQKRVFLFDSLNADAAESFIAIQAAKLSSEGLRSEKIIEELKDYSKNIKLFAALESADWLEAGGRINHSLAMLVNQMQKIGMRPILMIKDGEIKPSTLKMQASNTSSAILKELDVQIKEPLLQGKICRIIISHAGVPEDAEKIKNSILEKYKEKVEIEFISLTSCVIGAHVGPGALICCVTK